MATRPAACTALHVAAPITTALVVGAFIMLGPKSPALAYGKNPRRLLCRRLVLGLLVALFVAQSLVVALTADAISHVQHQVLHAVGLALVWAGELSRRHSDWELGTVSLVTIAFEVPSLVLSVVHPAGHGIDVAQLVLQASRLGLLAYLILDTSVGLFLGARSSGAVPDAEASEPLLHANGETNGYGAVPPSSAQNKDGDGDGDDEDEDADPSELRLKKRREQRLRETGGWLNYVKDFKIFWPILNPSKEPRVFIFLMVIGLCIVGDRFLNVAVPRQLGIVTDRLLAGEAPYKQLAVWLVLMWSGSVAGLGLVERLAKIPVRQFAFREITNAAFRHIMTLGMDFHSERDAGEINQAIDQGSVITNVLDWVVVDIAPALADIVIAMFLLYRKFNVYLSLCILASTVAFFSIEVYTSGNNRGNRRKYQKLRRESTRRMHQAVQNWPTVAYFNMFDYECDRYEDSVCATQKMGKAYETRDALNSGLVQTLVPVTFVMIASLAINEIMHGRSTPGDFVFLIQYWDNIIYPVRNLSWQYKYLMQDFVDAERLLELFQTKPSVAEKDGSIELPRATGHVTFDDVSFAYDPRRPTLTNVNIDVRPGQTLALVGRTGSGKSSIINLLHRFYDVASGSIKIDGHDIRDVTIGSLRDSLGMVPQKPMLFNVSVMENVRYARVDATDEEVYEACRAAAIHDQIMTFPDGYSTKVGDNGVKLSGGETQRVAIARVYLKSPPIIVLDEATSAVDSETEFLIQEAVETLRKQRTTFIIAHRLSTLMDADIIMLVSEGKIVECGTHDELLGIDSGRYKKLWDRQTGAMARGKKVSLVDDLIDIDEGDGSKSTE